MFVKFLNYLLLNFSFSNKTIVIISIIISISALTFVLCLFQSSTKIAYVDNQKLFDGFFMTKEMKQIGVKKFNAQNITIDSLYKKIQLTSGIEQQNLTKEYVLLKEQAEQFNQQFANQETQKIWKRISQYTSDYTKEHNYDVILGDNKQQQIWHISPNLDITPDLLEYINAKYEGIK